MGRRACIDFLLSRFPCRVCAKKDEQTRRAAAEEGKAALFVESDHVIRRLFLAYDLLFVSISRLNSQHQLVVVSEAVLAD